MYITHAKYREVCSKILNWFALFVFQDTSEYARFGLLCCLSPMLSSSFFLTSMTVQSDTCMRLFMWQSLLCLKPNKVKLIPPAISGLIQRVIDVWTLGRLPAVHWLKWNFPKMINLGCVRASPAWKMLPRATSLVARELVCYLLSYCDIPVL